MRLTIVSLLALGLGWASAGHAQILESPTEDPPPTPAAASEEISDQEVIRWAAREIGREDGREVGQRPPIPPDEYLARSRTGGPALRYEDDPAGDVLRILAELGMGSLGAGIGGGIAAVAIWATLEARANPSWTAIAVGAGTAVGAVALTAGVTLGGHLAGGRGNFGQAFLGQLIGSAAALPLVVLALDADLLPAALAAAGVLPLVGAVLGYEIGHFDAASGTSRPPVVAYASPTPGGALGGVVGALP